MTDKEKIESLQKELEEVKTKADGDDIAAKITIKYYKELWDQLEAVKKERDELQKWVNPNWNSMRKELNEQIKDLKQKLQESEAKVKELECKLKLKTTRYPSKEVTDNSLK